MRVTCLSCLACVSLCTLVLPVSAASTVSPEITGTWSGSATGRSYRERTESQDTSPLVEPAAASVTATLTQTGHDLLANLMVTPSDGSAFPMTLVGKVGDFAIWAQGTFTDGEGKAAQAFMSGHFNAKGAKLSGEIVIGFDSEIVAVTYKLTQTTAAAQTGAMQAFEHPIVNAKDTTDPPFNVVGKAKGNTYTFASNAKAGKYSALVNGTFVPATGTASLTLTTATAAQTFELNYMDTDYALAMTGQSGSEHMVVFLKTGQNSGSGTAWIFDDTHLIEIKISAKQQ